MAYREGVGEHTILMVVLKALLLEVEFKDWRRGNCWRDRLLELRRRRQPREAGVKATAVRATAGVLADTRGAACVREAIERTAARDEWADVNMATTGF